MGTNQTDKLAELREERDEALLKAVRSYRHSQHSANPKALMALAYVQAAYEVATGTSERARQGALGRMFEMQGLEVKKARARKSGKGLEEARDAEEAMLADIKARLGMSDG